MKFQFYIDGNPLVQGFTRWEFQWNPQQRIYLFQGKDTDPKDFDAVSREVFSPRYHSMFPKVRIAPGSLETAPQPAPVAAPVVPTAEPAAVPPPTEEMTLAAALEVVERYAPHRLKGKSGPKKKEDAPVPA